jgi:hypothetical protein
MQLSFIKVFFLTVNTGKTFNRYLAFGMMAITKAPRTLHFL